MIWRDALERMIWLAVVGAVTSLGTAPLFEIAAWKSAAIAAIQAVLGFVLLVAQARLKALPDPGAAIREQTLEDVRSLAPPKKRAARKV